MTEESKIDDMKTVGTESDGSRNERSPRDFWGGGGFVGCLIGVVWGAVAGGAWRESGCCDWLASFWMAYLADYRLFLR